MLDPRGPALDFDTFERVHAEAARVVGVMDGAAFAQADFATLGRCFRKILASSGCADSHATGIIRKGGAAEFHFRCSRLDDAERLVAGLVARGVALSGDPPHWRFIVDGELFNKLIGASDRRAKGRPCRPVP